MTFYHPKYYKELRRAGVQVNSSRPAHSRCNKSDQAISKEPATAGNQRSPGPGHKPQAREDSTANSTRGQVEEPQASSGKRQASAGGKPQAASLEKQASSPEEQASSLKP